MYKLTFQKIRNKIWNTLWSQRVQ